MHRFVWPIRYPAPAALAVATANAERLGLRARVAFHLGDLLGPLQTLAGRIDLVASNPPYVDPADRQSLSPEVRDHEPSVALFPQGEPCSLYGRLAAEARQKLEEKKKLDEARVRQQRATDAMRVQAEREVETRAQADRDARARAQQASKAESDWIRNIQAKVRGNVIIPPDMAGNPETIISAPTSPVAAPLVPLAAPAGPATVATPSTTLGPLTVTVTVGSTHIALTGTSQARLVSVVSSASGKVRARFVFAPKGIKFHGTKTIVRGRDASGHIVLTVVVRGDKTHGYQLRAANGGKQSKWLKLKNKRVILVATLSPGLRPSLAKAN
jgi:hypothetical protein